MSPGRLSGGGVGYCCLELTQKDRLESFLCGVILRTPNWTPSIIAPNAHDQNMYLVVEDFARNGSAYVATDVERTDLESVIGALLEGQYSNPVRVVLLNISGYLMPRNRPWQIMTD
jgi:hypothetical protein